jgi:hypothetical protein
MGVAGGTVPWRIVASIQTSPSSTTLNLGMAMGPTIRLPAGKNPIRVRVWGLLPPTGTLMGNFLTHRVKRVRVCSVIPQTRYPMGPPLTLTCGVNALKYAIYKRL